MRILAIDTSCGAASVAVVEGGVAEPLAVLSRPMARGHAEALAPMVEEAMRGVDGGFASLGRIAVATGPGSFTGIRVGLAMARAMAFGARNPGRRSFDLGRIRRAAAEPSRGPESSPRRSTLATARSIFNCLRRPAARWGRPAAIRRGNACARSAPARRGSRATRLRSSPMRRTEPACLTTSTPRETRRTLSPWRGWALPSTLSTSPARPIYVKPPDARPNPAEPIARAPA